MAALPTRLRRGSERGNSQEAAARDVSSKKSLPQLTSKPVRTLPNIKNSRILIPFFNKSPKPEHSVVNQPRKQLPQLTKKDLQTTKIEAVKNDRPHIHSSIKSPEKIIPPSSRPMQAADTKLHTNTDHITVPEKQVSINRPKIPIPLKTETPKYQTPALSGAKLATAETPVTGFSARRTQLTPPKPIDPPEKRPSITQEIADRVRSKMTVRPSGYLRISEI